MRVPEGRSGPKYKAGSGLSAKGLRNQICATPSRSAWLEVSQPFPFLRQPADISAMLAAPAYTERGRPIFLEYRGEWALIAFFATMSQTVGQTNFLSFFRITGTL